MYEKPVLVSTEAASLMEVLTHGNVARSHACMVANGKMNVYSDCTFHITIPNFYKGGVDLSNYQKIGVVANMPKETASIKDEYYSYPPSF